MERKVIAAGGQKAEAFDPAFWSGKRVWVTGHTGFKGAWLCAWLSSMGARAMGTSLASPARQSLAWEHSGLALAPVMDKRADIRDEGEMLRLAQEFKPDIVLHLAAQAIVLDSHKDMAGTWGANVMGTLNVLQAAAAAGAKAVVAVTSDKCYLNKEWEWGYRETDRLGGADPYSASKAACELLVASWRSSRGPSCGTLVASARAGNVIGGGDSAPWRILPEMLEAFGSGKPGSVRNPGSTRPFQHALEPLSGYMLLARRLYEQSQGGPAFDEPFNFGPGPDGEKSAGWLADCAADAWGGGAGVVKGAGEQGGKEARALMLDSAKAAKRLGWSATWDAKRAVELAVEWEKARRAGRAGQATMDHIAAFEEDTRAMGRKGE